MIDDELPEALLEDEEESGFVDLDLALTQIQSRPNGTVLVGRGRHESQIIGFAVELDAEWKPQPIGETDSYFYWGSGVIRSIGAESDALVKVLSELYGVPVAAGRMRPETIVSVVGLGDDPSLATVQPTRLKLFFESNERNLYAEVFLNVFASEGRVELHEKDPEYRAPLLRSIAE